MKFEVLNQPTCTQLANRTHSMSDTCRAQRGPGECHLAVGQLDETERVLNVAHNLLRQPETATHAPPSKTPAGNARWDGTQPGGGTGADQSQYACEKAGILLAKARLLLKRHVEGDKGEEKREQMLTWLHQAFALCQTTPLLLKQVRREGRGNPKTGNRKQETPNHQIGLRGVSPRHPCTAQPRLPMLECQVSGLLAVLYARTDTCPTLDRLHPSPNNSWQWAAAYFHTTSVGPTARQSHAVAVTARLQESRRKRPLQVTRQLSTTLLWHYTSSISLVYIVATGLEAE